MNDFFSSFDPVIEDPALTDPKFPPSLVPITFYSSGSKILGTMFTAGGGELHPTVLMLIGFPGNELNYDIAHTLRRQGFNVMTFFYRGCWGSEGTYSWKNILEDTVSALDFMKSESLIEKFRIDKNNISLIGYSIGGFNALYNSLGYNEIKNVVSIAGSNLGAFGDIVAGDKTIYNYAYSTMLPLMSFVKCESPKILLDEMIENKIEWNLLNHLEKLSSKNLLLIGAKYDATVPLDFNHIELVNALKQRKAKLAEFILETGHSFSNKRIQLMRIISDWYKQIEMGEK